MKSNIIRRALGAILLHALVGNAFVQAAENEKNEAVAKSEPSNMASSVHGWVQKGSHAIEIIRHDDEHDAGPHTFLGVETTKVSTTLGKQLGLDRGIGLVVARVIPDTGASEVLEKHDIMVKFEDQLVISPDQLGVLVRSKEPGTKVPLTIVRAGTEQVVTVELREGKAKTIAIKMGSHFPEGMDPARLRKKFETVGSDISREEVETLMGTLRGQSHGDMTIFAHKAGAGPVVRMMNVKRGNIVFTDDEGTTKLISDDASTRLVVMDSHDNVLFDGPVETDEQRAALDEAIESRLKKVEDLRAMEMKVDHDFEIDEDVHVTVPHASLNSVGNKHGLIN